MTGIVHPCPDCGTDLLFTREGRNTPITAFCETCGHRYAMTPDRVDRIDNIVTEPLAEEPDR